jgi:hypothetical protein
MVPGTAMTGGGATASVSTAAASTGGTNGLLSMPFGSDPQFGSVLIYGETEILGTVNVFLGNLKSTSAATGQGKGNFVKSAETANYVVQPKSDYSGRANTVKFILRVDVQDLDGSLLTRLVSKPTIELDAVPGATTSDELMAAQMSGIFN